MENIRIRRAEKGKRNPFVMVVRATSENSELSWNARAVLTYVLGKPDDWVVTVKDLINAGPLGRDGIYSVVNELIEFGHFERITHRNKGRFAGQEIIVHEIPIKVKLPAQPSLEMNSMETANMG